MEVIQGFLKAYQHIIALLLWVTAVSLALVSLAVFIGSRHTDQPDMGLVGSKVTEASGQVVNGRIERDLDGTNSSDAESEFPEDNDRVLKFSQTEPEDGSSVELGNENRSLARHEYSDADTVWDVRRLMARTSTCITGQGNSNMPPVCGTTECLMDLNVIDLHKTDLQMEGGEGETQIKLHRPRKKTVTLTDAFLKFMNEIPGWTYLTHAHVVNLLTDMQWNLGVYGAVGEIGVYRGRFSSVLAYHTDTDHGERFFACDAFDKPGQLYAEQAYRISAERFFRNMGQLGFQLNHSDPAMRLHVWYDSSVYFTKYAYLQMRLPSARFVSLDGFHHGTLIVHELIQILCVLHPGGIIAIDDIFNGAIQKALVDFMNVISPDVIRPLIYIDGKLYVTTADWYQAYMEELESRVKHRKLGHVKLKKGNFTLFGHECFYPQNLKQ